MHKLIVGLIGLNLILIGCLAVVFTQKTSRQELASSMPSSTPDTTASVSLKSVPKPVVEKFSWASLASHDLRTYAANLRRIGCPEETIKEIMIAEVNRLYAPQECALKVRPDDIAPWEESSRRDKRGAESKLRQLLEEKRGLLKELAGVDVGIDMPSRLAGRDVDTYQNAFASLPESKRDQVRAIQENYWAQSDDIKQRTMGYLEPEDRAEFVRIKSERREALAKILTPQELQDYELTTSATAPALRSRFEGFDISDAEFRRVFDYVQPLDEQYSLSRKNPDPVNEEFTAARTQAETDVLNYIKQVLGDDRYTEYQRTRDPVYRSINQIGTDVGASKESIVEAYQMQQQMQAESKQILQDKSLTPEQRAQSLEQMRTQAEQKIQQIFGDKAPQILQRLTGNRMDNQMAERYGIPVNPTINIPVPTPEQ